MYLNKIYLKSNSLIIDFYLIKKKPRTKHCYIQAQIQSQIQYVMHSSNVWFLLNTAVKRIWAPVSAQVNCIQQSRMSRMFLWQTVVVILKLFLVCICIQKGEKGWIRQNMTYGVYSICLCFPQVSPEGNNVNQYRLSTGEISGSNGIYRARVLRTLMNNV